MKEYHRLCLRDREIISLLFHSGTSIREIGRYLGRSPSTISREIQRNKTGFYYVPTTTNNKARRHGGVLRTIEAIRLGIHPRTLYQMRDTGRLEQLGRGLYRLADMLPVGNPDLVVVALKVPKGVICLLSALAYHELTTQIPHEVHLALLRGAEPPRLKHPPVRVFWFTNQAFSEGIDVDKVDEVNVRIYCPEKTLADCFKYRNKIGPDTEVEALRGYIGRGRPRIDKLMLYARVCRVEKVMRPYLEALL